VVKEAADYTTIPKKKTIPKRKPKGHKTKDTPVDVMVGVTPTPVYTSTPII